MRTRQHARALRRLLCSLSFCEKYLPAALWPHAEVHTCVLCLLATVVNASALLARRIMLTAPVSNSIALLDEQLDYERTASIGGLQCSLRLPSFSRPFVQWM